MQPERRDREPREQGDALQGQDERQPGISEVQDPDDRLAQGREAAPLREPDRLDERRGARDAPGGPGIGLQQVGTSSSGRLRLRLRSSGGASSTHRTAGKARSTVATSSAGQCAEVASMTRANSQRTASSTRGPPAKPFDPVQLGTAVSRKPATAAPRKPKSISCPCQTLGAHVLSSGAPKAHTAIQRGMSTSAERPAARNAIRNPLANNLPARSAPRYRPLS